MIAETAKVHNRSLIGARTKVWDYAQIREGVQIGEDCVIGRNVYVGPGVIIGSRSKVQNNALIYEPARIGAGVFIGPGVIVTNDRVPRAVNPDFSVKTAGDWVASPVVIEDGASLGAGVIVVAGCRVGRFAMIGAGAVVTSDVPPYAVMVGVPARQVGVCDDSDF